MAAVSPIGSRPAPVRIHLARSVPARRIRARFDWLSSIHYISFASQRLSSPSGRISRMPTAIQCRDLRKTYDGKVEAVRGLNLEIQAGECFGLLGPNGAGKTTTIEILEGLLQPTSGEVTILGRTWQQDSRELRELMGISLQETRLSEKLTVRETVELFSSFYHQPRRPEVILEQLQLSEKA